MPLTDEKTLNYYEENARRYAARQPRFEDSEALSHFLSLLPKTAQVCDLGCGNGWATAKMIVQGCSVIPIDASEQMAAEAKRMHDIDVIIEDFDDFSYQDVFDGFWSCWVLHHTTVDNFANLLTRVAKSVRPGGVIFFSLKGGSSNRRDEKDRLYAEFNEDALLDIIHRSVPGTILNHRTWQAATADGNTSLRHATFIRKQP